MEVRRTLNKDLLLAVRQSGARYKLSDLKIRAYLHLVIVIKLDYLASAMGMVA